MLDESDIYSRAGIWSESRPMMPAGSLEGGRPENCVLTPWRRNLWLTEEPASNRPNCDPRLDS